MDLHILFTQLSKYAASGIEQKKIFSLLANCEENIYLKIAFETILDKLKEGADINVAFATTGIFEDIVVSSIESGVISGNLDILYKNLAEIYFQKADIVSRVDAALLVPKIGLGISCIALFAMQKIILPKYKIIFAQNRLEFPTILTIFGTCIDILFIAAPIIIVLIFLARYFLQNNKNYKLYRKKLAMAWDSIKLQVPIFSELYFLYLQYLISINMAVLLKSSIPLVKTIEQTAKTIPSPIISNALLSIKENIISGEKLYSALENKKEISTTLFGFKIKRKQISSHIISFVTTGEETGNTDSLLFEASQIFSVTLKAILPKKEQLLAFLSLLPLIAIILMLYLTAIMPALSYMDQLVK